MSSLTIDLFSSLDGYAAGEGWPGYYGKEGPELLAWLDEKLAEDQIIVMGATTYRMMSGIVATGDDPTFARMTEIPKVVFSSTLEPPLSWANTQIVDEDAVTALRRMKAESTVPLRTMGSTRSNGSLLRAGIADACRLSSPGRHPGDGSRADLRELAHLDLELDSTRTLDGRMQVMRYVPTLHDGP